MKIYNFNEKSAKEIERLIKPSQEYLRIDMVKGTPSMGKRRKIIHIRCRRCGRHSYNLKTKVCAACGYGKSSKIRKYAWQTHDLRRIRIK